MVQVADGVATFELSGNARDGMIWWALGLLVLGLAVAWVCFTMPSTYAIGAMFGFAVMVFLFNIQKQKAKHRHIFCVGTLKLSPRRFEIDQKGLTFSPNAQITINDGWIMVTDGQIQYQFGGFVSEQELMLAKEILSGRAVATRFANIRLNDTDQL